MDEMGKRISTVEPTKKQQEESGEWGNMQNLEAGERDHGAGKMTGEAV